MIPGLLRRGLPWPALAAGTAVIVLAAAGAWWWRRPAPPAPPLTTLLPRGSSIISQARVDLDGREPMEIAATSYIPSSPGSPVAVSHAVVAGYDRRRHRWRVLLLRPLAGIPAALEAGPLLGSREAVVFPTYTSAGVGYQVITLRRGRPVVLYEGQAAGPVEVVGTVIAERNPVAARGLRWDGRAFREVPAPPSLPPTVVWRFWTDRNGFPRAESNTVFLVPGQRLLPVRNGGGPAVVPIPDGLLDVVGPAFRPRRPGVYTLTVPDFAGRPGGSFRLSIEVENKRP